ncbi:ABC transporter substrate-binding protein [Streptacidiphilus monticola]|uniref:Probable sugar-binding periplasmic protein n=1 Tax=Streptacidiphilus monticola TaxID=2161674 RepID=A0ABW1FT79_9ACTN
MTLSRRAFLAASGAAAAGGAGLLLSGCDSSGGNQPKPSTLEVFSWWTAGGEKDALDSLVNEFHLTHPEIAFDNAAVAGGAGAAAKAELAKRMKEGNPPDTFQAQAGAMLADYVDADQLEDLGFLYESQGWEKVFHPTVLQLIKRNGRYYSVPVDIHHINVLWSNVAVCNRYRADLEPADPAAFIASLKRVRQGNQVTPLAIGLTPDQNWQVKHLMETLLVAHLQADDWAALWRPGNGWEDSRVTDALHDLSQILDLVPAGSAYTWDEACALVAQGKAAYQVMGDWTEAKFTVDFQLQPKRQYHWAATPGTKGLFVFASDCFTLPKGAKHRDATVDWLTECGSQRGQDSFTTVKGAIPPRAKFDADEVTLFDTYSRWSMQEWGKDRVVGSLTHGVVASAAWNSAIDAAITAFVAGQDVAQLQGALAKAAKAHAK